MKIAVLGLNDTTLVVLDAINSRGNHEAYVVVPTTEDFIDPSPLNELNFGYPGVEDSVINFQIRGTQPWRDAHPELHKAGFEAFEGKKGMASSIKIYAKIAQTPNAINNIIWNPDTETLRECLEREIGGADAIINVLDRAQLCGAEDHTFILTRVWWSTEKGPQVGEGQVLYNTDPNTSWAMTSNIDGRIVTIWDKPVPFDSVYTYDMPTKMVCNCETLGIDLHVGRWATYAPIGLSRAYEQVLEFLYHPLSHINEDTLQMLPVDYDLEEAPDGGA